MLFRYSIITFFLGACAPYSVEACKSVAKALGKNLGGDGYKFASSRYNTKGCYGYESGDYAKHIFFGMGGTKDQMKKALATPKFGPLGYDCKNAGEFLLDYPSPQTNLIIVLDISRNKVL